MRRLAGAAIVPGLGVGRAVLLVRRGRALRTAVAPSQVAAEVARIERACARSREQLVAIKERLAQGPGAELAGLFDAQILMLDDPLLIARALTLVRDERANADWAVQRAFDVVTAESGPLQIGSKGFAFGYFRDFRQHVLVEHVNKNV